MTKPGGGSEPAAPAAGADSATNGRAAGTGPRSATLWWALLFAAASLGWAAFLWWELADVRAGGEAFCALGGGGCEQLWESGFARAIERSSGLPIAAWGVVWGAAAMGLSLYALLARARTQTRAGGRAGGRSGEPGGSAASGAGSPRASAADASWAAVVVTAFGGGVGVLGLLAASLGMGAFCSSCALSYVFTAAFAGVVLRDARGVDALPRGSAVSAGAVATLALLLALPGWLRPSAADRAAAAIEKLSLPENASTVERSIVTLYKDMTAEGLQAMADSLERYRSSPDIPLRPARAVVGSRDAKLRMTEFVDVQCGHCAALHETVEQLRGALPSESFALEARHFPLDRTCNENVTARGDGIRCLAARALICAEGETWAFDFAGALFEIQASLDEARLWKIAERYTAAAAMRECAASEATAASLRDDIDWAMAHNLRGTPLVLVDGRKADVFPAFLYAILLTGGDTEHAVFAHLPPPRGA